VPRHTAPSGLAWQRAPAAHSMHGPPQSTLAGVQPPSRQTPHSPQGVASALGRHRPRRLRLQGPQAFLRFRLWGLLAPAGSIRARIAPPIAVSPTSARARRGASVCSRRSATRHRSDYRPWFLPGLIGISPAVQTLSTANAPTAPTRRSRSQRNLGVTRAMSSTAQRARRKTCWISPAGSRPRSDGGWLRRNRDQSSPEATSSDHWGRPAPTGPVVMRSIARPSPARTHTSL
jgi:hypothetical protein